MQQNGKLIIAAYLAKNPDRMLRQRNVSDATGLSRQLVKYHMDSLVEDGAIERVAGGNYYKVTAPDTLVDLLLTGDRAKNLPRKMRETKYVTDEEVIGFFNDQLKLYLALKSLKFDHHGDIRSHLVSRLNETIDHFTELRKFVQNAGTTTELVAAKIIRKYGYGEASRILDPLIPINKNDAEAWMNSTCEDILINEN